MQALAYPAQELQMEKSSSMPAAVVYLVRNSAIPILGQVRMGLSPQQPTWKACRLENTAFELPQTLGAA